jgi:hypothetical protein
MKVRAGDAFWARIVGGLIGRGWVFEGLDRLLWPRCRLGGWSTGPMWSGNAERPGLAPPARLRDTDSSQRPRPVATGTQRLGELVEELAHPGTLDLLDGHAIDSGSPAVCTDIAPGPQHDVAAGDLVEQGMEAAIPILLGTAVEHALESTDTVHALGAADGPSRVLGTHQSPSLPSRASMKRGPFPPRGFCCPVGSSGVGSGEAAVRMAATSARPSEPLVQFSRKRLSPD